MLQTNLSTRPFYNERAVHGVLAAVAVVLVALTAANVWQALRLSKGSGTLQAQAAKAEERAAGLRRSAAGIRRGIDAHQLELVSTGAREANALIDRRTFSWTELFNRFETTLPDNVRIVSVRPRVDRRRGTLIEIAVVARDTKDVNQFIENLEATHAFTNALTVEDRYGDNGEYQAMIEAGYNAAAAPAPKAQGETQ